MPQSPQPLYPHARTGLLYASVAFGWWAFVVPTYFRVLTQNNADPFEVLAQRVIFGLPILLVMLAFSRQLGVFIKAASSWSSLRVLIPSTGLIAINWYFFIFAVSTDRLSHASLGYYINPLVSIALAYLFLGERPRPVQWGAIALASTAVAVMAYAELTMEVTMITNELGVRVPDPSVPQPKGFPWISILLPASFGMYGLLRKKANVGASVGLTFEMALMLPLCAFLLIWLGHNDRGVFLADATPGWISVIMVLGGIVTIVPLFCFTNAVRLLPLSTVGLLQYTAPTGQLVLAAIFFGEHFTPMKFAAFGIIWLAIGIYTFDMLRGQRQAKAKAALVQTEMLE